MPLILKDMVGFGIIGSSRGCKFSKIGCRWFCVWYCLAQFERYFEKSQNIRLLAHIILAKWKIFWMSDRVSHNLSWINQNERIFECILKLPRVICAVLRKKEGISKRKLPRIIYALLKLNARKMLPHAIWAELKFLTEKFWIVFQNQSFKTTTTFNFSGLW